MVKTKLAQKVYRFDCDDKGFQERSKEANHGYFPHAFRAIICGKPNSGKTSTVFNIILQHDAEKAPFERFIVIHYLGGFTREYDKLGKENMRMLTTVPTKFLSLFSSEHDDLPDFQDAENMDPRVIEVIDELKETKTCIILDDLDYKGLNKKQISVVNRLMGCLSSHLNCSVILTCQEPINIPPGIRRLANYVILFKHQDKATNQLISARFDISVAKLNAIFKYLCPFQHDSLTLSYDHLPKLRKNLFEAIASSDDENDI